MLRNPVTHAFSSIVSFLIWVRAGQATPVTRVNKKAKRKSKKLTSIQDKWKISSQTKYFLDHLLMMSVVTTYFLIAERQCGLTTTTAARPLFFMRGPSLSRLASLLVLMAFSTNLLVHFVSLPNHCPFFIQDLVFEPLNTYHALHVKVATEP